MNPDQIDEISERNLKEIKERVLQIILSQIPIEHKMAALEAEYTNLQDTKEDYPYAYYENIDKIKHWIFEHKVQLASIKHKN